MPGVTSLLCPKDECQRSVNNFWHCVVENPRAVQRHCYIIVILAAILGKNAWDIIATLSYESVSMEPEPLLTFHVRKCKGCAATLTDSRTNSHLSWQQWLRQHRYYDVHLSINGVSMERQWSINWVSTIFCHAACTIQELCIDMHPKSTYRLPLWGKMLVTIPLPPPENKCQQSGNKLCGAEYASQQRDASHLS